MQAVGWLSFLCFLAAAALLVRMTRPRGFVEASLSFFLSLAGIVVLVASVLSVFSVLDDHAWWFGGSAFCSLAAAGAALLVKRCNRQERRPGRAEPARPGGSAAHSSFSNRLETVRLLALIAAAGLCGAANLVLVIFTAPGTWDCMSYHLARAAYFLQQGSFDPYGADYWAQIVHPRNAAAFAVFCLGPLGSENLTQAVQYAAWWAASLSVFGVARRIGLSARASLFAGLLFFLLTICLMQASTAQNDMLLAACLGASLFFLLSCRGERRLSNFVFAGAGLGLAVGIKANALLALPSFVLIGWWVFRHRVQGRAERPRRRTLAAGLGAALAGFCLFSLPSGYLDNSELFGHPLGPRDVRIEHSFEERSITETAGHGLLNAVRYGFEFLALDGIPPSRTAEAVQEALRFGPQRAAEAVGVDPESTAGARAPFRIDAPPESHEDGSYWGIFGFALILPLALLVLCNILKVPRGRGAGAVLAWAGLLFFLAHCFSGPYDPWRGRYFMALGLFLAPIGGAFVESRGSRIWNGYATLVVLAGSMAALSAVAFRDDRPFLPAAESVFQMDRLEQMTANVVLPKRRQALEQTLRRYEEIVPPDAVVATFLEGNSFEYPLFGKGLTRRVIPLNSFVDGRAPIPPEADYLLFSSGGPFSARKGDIPLGAHPGRSRSFWFLRTLHTGDQE